ncbi:MULTISPECIES: hypothetical protein [Niastella]|uniref:Tetratricopeptide repeat protein n=1 Tax=Niastella soli TaxID=2821487 RepID=A0ABS3YX74_9BACT|nr:hypothetical protein [Niastella soli]MBO9202015.1 hypothetical protein [Niastella soli]
MDKAALEEQLQEITYARDDGRLHELIQSLSVDDRQQYKTELGEAFLDIYAIWFYDFDCGKVETNEGPDPFFSYLLELLADAERVDPSRIYNEQRAFCYQAMAGLKTNPDEQLSYIEKAAQEIGEALNAQPDSCGLNNQLVSILLDKIKFRNVYSDDEFVVVLGYFEQGLSNYSSSNQLNLIYKCFDILQLSFPRNRYWHGVFLEKVNTVLRERAENDPLIYLEWVNELKRIVENYEGIPPAYAQELARQSAQLLTPLTNFETANPETLNKLGTAFSKTADKLSEQESIAEALTYYNVAVEYFTKAQDINPAAWTYPVYATNALKAMAVLYAGHNKVAVIALFEKGRYIFSKLYEPEKDFTANLYWGEFLIEYARLAHDFQSPAILQEAEERFLIAQGLGLKYYDHPYLGRAKVALKLGDPERCLAILQECKAVFSELYTTYSLSKVIEDEDFAALKQEIIVIDNS